LIFAIALFVSKKLLKNQNTAGKNKYWEALKKSHVFILSLRPYGNKLSATSRVSIFFMRAMTMLSIPVVYFFGSINPSIDYS